MTIQTARRRLNILERKIEAESDHIEAFQRDLERWREAGENETIVSLYDQDCVYVHKGTGGKPYNVVCILPKEKGI